MSTFEGIKRGRMSTALQYAGVSLANTDIDRERLLSRGMVNQINMADNSRHSLRGKPRKIWVLGTLRSKQS